MPASYPPVLVDCDLILIFPPAAVSRVISGEDGGPLGRVRRFGEIISAPALLSTVRFLSFACEGLLSELLSAVVLSMTKLAVLCIGFYLVLVAMLLYCAPRRTWLFYVVYCPLTCLNL